VPLCLSSAPLERMRGAGRRQALVRKRRTRGPSRERAHLRIAGDDRRDTPAGAPLGALLRLSASPWVMPQLRAALFPAMNRGCQRAPRAGVVVPQGRVPKPPGCELARLARGRRASGVLPAAGLGRASPRPPPACSATKTPHDGAPRRAGCEDYPSGLCGEDNFFSGELSSLSLVAPGLDPGSPLRRARRVHKRNGRAWRSPPSSTGYARP
jgi:hypothetical protein